MSSTTIYMLQNYARFFGVEDNWEGPEYPSIKTGVGAGRARRQAMETMPMGRERFYVFLEGDL